MANHYETQDEIERSLREITNIIDEAKESDPEFYEELKEIFEAGTGQQVRVVMPDGYLPAFDGEPVLASCTNCAHCADQSDGPEYPWPSWYACEKPGREFMTNLKGFPFKTSQKCCELSIAFTVDWEAEAKKMGEA